MWLTICFSDLTIRHYTFCLMKKLCYLFWGGCLCLSACASLDRNLLDDANREMLHPASLSMDYDVYFLRIDLIRNTTTVSSSNPTGANTSQTQEEPYHYLGFDLGNGLFYDANQNLCLDIMRLSEFAGRKNFAFAKQYPRFGRGTVRYYRQDNLFVRQESGLLQSKFEATFGDATVTVDEGFLSPKRDIEISPDLLYYKEGLFATRIKRQSYQYQLSQGLGKQEYYASGNNIYLDRDLIVQNLGNRIEVANARAWRYRPFTFIKTEEGYFFFDNRSRGIRIVVDDYGVSVFENNRLLYTYVLAQSA